MPSQPGYMYPSYDWNVPGPSTEEIKDLLSNIRPDEDIKVEDKDAIIEGMAPQMRLMKHQQVRVLRYDLTVDGIGMDAKDGGQQEQGWSARGRDGSWQNYSKVLAPKLKG